MTSKQRSKTLVTAVVAIVIILVAAGAGAYYYFTSSSATSSSAMMTSSATPITIGMITPLSGTFQPDGIMVQYGAQLAINQINANGGVLGRPLKLVAQDEGSTTAETVNAAQVLVSDYNASFIIGPFFSGDVKSVLPTTYSHKVVEILSVSGVDSLMVSPQNQYLFRTTLDDYGGAQMLVQWLKMIGAKNVMFEGEDYLYVHETYNQTSQLASAAGITLQPADYYPGDATDYSSAINKIATNKPDAVIVIMEGTNGIDFQKQYVANPITSKIPVLHYYSLLADVSNDQSIDAAVPNGMNGTFLGLTTYPTNQTQSFITQFEQAFNTPPINPYGYDSYSGMMMLVRAIQNAGTVNTDAVAAALVNVQYLGPGGLYGFVSNHNPITGPGYLSGSIDQITVDSSGGIHFNVLWPMTVANATAFNPATGKPY